MPSNIQKLKLSGSTDGKNIKVTATATAGTTVHTAKSGTTAGQFDEIWVYATNTSASDVLTTIEYGGVTSPDDTIIMTVPARSMVCMVPGLILQNSLVVRCFAASANVILISGFVNRITA